MFLASVLPPGKEKHHLPHPYCGHFREYGQETRFPHSIRGILEKIRKKSSGRRKTSEEYRQHTANIRSLPDEETEIVDET